MTDVAGETRAVHDALGQLRQMLEADGYALSVDDLTDGTAHVTVSATEAACADCLAPKSVVADIMLNALSTVPGVRRVDLTYPSDETTGH
jgi:hypothetical protein